MRTEKIVSIQRVPPEPVYNLSIAIDESYTANNIVVHNCRSRIKPYIGNIPGKRDFKAQFSPEMLARAQQTQSTFRSKYWVPAPRTKASAYLQRSYLDKRDLITLRDGLTLTRNTSRDPVGIGLLKSRIRYRKLDPDKSTIVDSFGKGIMFDKIERQQLKDALNALVIQSRSRQARNIAKGLDSIAALEQIKIDRYLGILNRIV